MQAIEFETVVQARSIPLPSSAELASGQAVRVLVLFEPRTGVRDQTADLDAILRLARNPVVIPDFVPLSRDAAHER